MKLLLQSQAYFVYAAGLRGGGGGLMRWHSHVIDIAEEGAGSREAPAREQAVDLLQAGKVGGIGVLGVCGREDMHHVYHKRYRKVS